MKELIKFCFTLSTILVLMACETTALGANTADIPMKDIQGHWAEHTIKESISKGYVDGYEDGTFRPDQTVSRAEFVKQVVTAFNLAVDQKGGSAWYAPYLDAARKAGILHDSDFPDDNWNTPILRAEVAKIAVRAAHESFRDPDTQMSDDEAMYFATKSGFINGDASGSLAPEGMSNRGQSVTIIDRVLRNIAGDETLEFDALAVAQAELALYRTNMFSAAPEFFGGDKVAVPWEIEKLTMETPDGKYKGVLDQLVVIDLEDPNDPYLHMLGDVSSLTWSIGRNKYPITDYPKSYVLLFKAHTEFNRDTAIYGENMIPGFGLIGFRSPDIPAMGKGDLNGAAPVFGLNPQFSEAYIVPKSFANHPSTVGFQIAAPAIPPNNDYLRNIFDVWVEGYK